MASLVNMQRVPKHHCFEDPSLKSPQPPFNKGGRRGDF
jgi:hypothetical protein